jgi:hypothetical protein
MALSSLGGRNRSLGGSCFTRTGVLGALTDWAVSPILAIRFRPVSGLAVRMATLTWTRCRLDISDGEQDVQTDMHSHNSFRKQNPME